MINAEVIVVGGGPAGSTCAWKLSRNGIETIVLDKKIFPRQKVCAGWITPKVLKDLQLRIEDYPHSFLTFERLHFRFKGKKLAVRTRQHSIRRYEFDHWLLQRSEVPVHQHPVKHIRQENGHYVIDDLFRCKYLVGAGGTHCPVYRTFFTEANPRAQNLLITAMEEEFPYDYQDKSCYLWFFEWDLPGYGWYVPKGNGQVNVGLGGKFAVLKDRKQTIRDYWQPFVRKLDDLRLVQEHSFSPKGHNYYLRQDIEVGQVGNAFIIGDAAGLATLDMGEGIGTAVESGILAARAIATGCQYSLAAMTKYSFIRILLPWWK